MRIARFGEGRLADKPKRKQLRRMCRVWLQPGNDWDIAPTQRRRVGCSRPQISDGHDAPRQRRLREVYAHCELHCQLGMAYVPRPRGGLRRALQRQDSERLAHTAAGDKPSPPKRRLTPSRLVVRVWSHIAQVPPKLLRRQTR